MTTELDRRIHEMVSDLVEQSPDPHPISEVLPHDLPAPEPARPAALTMALAAAAVLIVGSLGVYLAIQLIGDDPGTDPSSTSTTLAVDPDVEWQSIAAAPGGLRRGHEVVWTGTEMIVLGGTPLDWDGTTPALDGVLSYDSDANSWTELPESPHAMLGMSVVWTGSEVIVWGGQPTFSSPDYSDVGAIYDVDADSWRTIPDAPIPGRRWPHAVWTGREMMVWGGVADPDGGALAIDGAAYNPTTDEWRPIADAPYPLSPVETTAIWDGVQMMLWSGSEVDDSGGFIGRGLIYDPATDTWVQMPEVPVLGGSYRGVWTGDEMVVIGGGQIDASGMEVLAFDPSSEQWRLVSQVPVGGREEFRWNFEAVWTGTHVAVIGGDRNAAFGRVEKTLLVDPLNGAWIGVEGPVDQVAGHSAMWAGDEILIWGGDESVRHRWRPDASLRLPRRPAIEDSPSTVLDAFLDSLLAGDCRQAVALSIASWWAPPIGDTVSRCERFVTGQPPGAQYERGDLVVDESGGIAEAKVRSIDTDSGESWEWEALVIRIRDQWLVGANPDTRPGTQNLRGLRCDLETEDLARSPAFSLVPFTPDRDIYPLGDFQVQIVLQAVPATETLEFFLTVFDTEDSSATPIASDMVPLNDDPGSIYVGSTVTDIDVEHPRTGAMLTVSCQIEVPN